jgi:hypothetical protein
MWCSEVVGCITIPHRRALDVKEVIWIATSNIAYEMMLESGIVYDDLKLAVRGRVTEQLGVTSL